MRLSRDAKFTSEAWVSTLAIDMTGPPFIPGFGTIFKVGVGSGSEGFTEGISSFDSDGRRGLSEGKRVRISKYTSLGSHNPMRT